MGTQHDLYMSPRLAAAAVAALPAFAIGAGAQDRPLPLRDVLRNAGEYVAEFQRQLSGIVAEELYVQRVTADSPLQSPRFHQPAPLHRELRSDLLLVRPAADSSWVQFRDVFEVDGTTVRDRSDRLTALFLQPSETSAAQANRIRNESARYNIGNVIRTINVPLLPMQVLMPANQSRFRFERAEADEGRDQPDARLPSSPNFRVSTEVWVVRFKETKRRTLIRDIVRNADVFSEGRFWIEPASGRVLMSELVADTGDLRAQINVSYQSEPLLGLLVPVEMKETYSRLRRQVVEATATYGKFRRFQVHVNEQIAPTR